MLVNPFNRFVILSIFSFAFGLSENCLSKEVSNYNLFFSLIQNQNNGNIGWTKPKTKSCLVSSMVSGFKLTTCFNVKETDCNLEYFNNLKLPRDLQNRIDDLNFININFPNCTTGATQLFLKYGSLQTPTSLILKDTMNKNGSNVNNDFHFSNQISCQELGLFDSKYVSQNFQQILTFDELSQLNSVISDLALMPSTSNSCLGDLNYNPSLINLTNNIKLEAYKIGISCSYDIASSVEICPW